MAAYVFSVGGARGAFQAWAAIHLIDHASREWQPTSAYGNSVGALNAAMVATGQTERLGEIWRTVSNKKVYKHRFGVGRAIYAIISGRPMLDTSPLVEMLEDELLGVVCEMPLTVQYVTPNGRLETVTVEAGQAITDIHIRSIYNSTVIPFAFPVTYGGYDGGIFNPIPLNPAIEREQAGSKMVVFSAHPLDPVGIGDQPKRSTGHLVRAISLLQRGLIHQNVKTFEAINRATQRGEVPGFKHFDAMMIAPELGTWWGMLDFDGSSSDQVRYYAEAQARRALELKQPLS